MNPIEQIKDGLYLSTRSILNMIGYEKDITVLFSHNDVMSPEDEYCVISIINIKQDGNADSSDAIFRASMSDEIDYVGFYQIHVQYSFIGKNSSWFATEFQHSLANNMFCRQEITANKLGYLHKTNLRNAPQRWETQWVDGWNFDVTYTYSLTTRYKFEWIDKVIIKGNGVTTVVEYTE